MEKQPAEEATPELMLPDEVVAQKIYLIRGKKVMLDRDLADLYGVETKRLKEQVRRNLERFPEDFMFELTKEELENWRSQFATSNSENMGLRHQPFAFSEHGVLMLSSVLNSKRAIAVNIKIMRIYTRLREMLLSNADMLLRMERMDHELQVQGRSIETIYEYLAEMREAEPEPRELIGFRLPGQAEEHRDR
ncbi:MAG: ORF6N domain-containing protein [Bacteroidia bacterium]